MPNIIVFIVADVIFGTAVSYLLYGRKAVVFFALFLELLPSYSESY